MKPINLRGEELVASDLERVLKPRWIDRNAAEAAFLRSASSEVGAEAIGRNGGGNYEGILVPNIFPGEDRVRDWILRRNHPDIESGKAKGKYLMPPGRGNLAYFPPGVTADMLADIKTPILIAEGPLKALALWRAAWPESAERPLAVPMAINGVWGFRGTIGKVTDADGARVDEKGVIPDFSRIAWEGRRVVIIFDRDVNDNGSVQAARKELTRHLQQLISSVSYFVWPKNVPAGVKGVDDFLASRGPEETLKLIVDAKRAPRRKVANAASAADDDAEVPSGPAGLAFFNNTDVGNGKRLVHLYGSRIRHFHKSSKWLAWDGKRWAFDDTAEVVRLAKATVRQMFKASTRLTDSGARDRLFNFARETEKSARLEAMIRMASSEEKIPVRIEDLDADPWLLNVNNGTLDLHSGELRPHDERDLLTKLAPIDYDPKAECPAWLEFQRAITCGDDALIEFKRRIIGYSLTGDVSDKRSFFLLHGKKDTGKTTEIELLRDLLGDYAAQIRIAVLMEQKFSSNGGAPSPDIADLRGCRLVTSSEPGEGQKLGVAITKYLTGTGRIKARHLNQENIEFQQTWKFFLDCNVKPEVTGTDPAIWNRIGTIPFNMKSLEEGEQDKTLPAKLRAELPGILAWAVQGCLGWQRGGLRMPKIVADATEKYRLENDQIGRFLEERCELLDRLSVSGDTLYAEYSKWCTKTGQVAENGTRFGSYEWSSKNISKRHTNKGVKYDGIAMQSLESDGL